MLLTHILFVPEHVYFFCEGVSLNMLLIPMLIVVLIHFLYIACLYVNMILIHYLACTVPFLNMCIPSGVKLQLPYMCFYFFNVYFFMKTYFDLFFDVYVRPLFLLLVCFHDRHGSTWDTTV